MTVKEQKGTAFTLAWTTDGLSNPDGAITSNGQVSFQETNSGLVNTDWTSTPPPPQFPVLCAAAAQCPNALSSVFYNVIWGSRNPVLDEPLLKGLRLGGNRRRRRKTSRASRPTSAPSRSRCPRSRCR